MLSPKNVMRKNIAEFIGTFTLVFFGCGSALTTSGQDAGAAHVLISLAFGISVLAMIYAVGNISGANFNPAVTIGLYVAGRLEGRSVLPYIASQLLGALAAAGVLYLTITGKSDAAGIGSFASNGYGEHSPGNYSLVACVVAEFVTTFLFMFIILGATDAKAPVGFAGVAIGLTLTLIHLFSIPITNTSVNPARSLSQALFAGDWALSQVWMFIIIPIVGASLAGVLYKSLKS